MCVWGGCWGVFGKDLFTRMMHIIRGNCIQYVCFELLLNNTVWGIAVGQRQIDVFE